MRNGIKLRKYINSKGCMKKRSNKENKSPNYGSKKQKPFCQNKPLNISAPILSKELKSMVIEESNVNTNSDGNLPLLLKDIKITSSKKAKLTKTENSGNLTNFLATVSIKEYNAEELLKLVKMKNFNPNFCYNKNGNSLIYLVLQLPNIETLDGKITYLPHGSGMEMASILLFAGCTLNEKDIECLNKELLKDLDSNDLLSSTESVKKEEDDLFIEDGFPSFLDSHNSSFEELN